MRIEAIAKNREQPRFEICSGHEAVARAPCLHQGFLRKVLGEVPPAAQSARKRSEMGRERDQVALKLISMTGRRCRRNMCVLRFMRLHRTCPSCLTGISQFAAVAKTGWRGGHKLKIGGSTQTERTVSEVLVGGF
jgi:hypothetical protein